MKSDMQSCSLCKGRFAPKWMKGTQCHQCVKEHGPDVDREKVLKEANPDLYPLHEYVEKKDFEELLLRVDKLEGAPDKIEAVIPNVEFEKRGPGRPKKKVEVDNGGG